MQLVNDAIQPLHQATELLSQQIKERSEMNKQLEELAGLIEKRTALLAAENQKKREN